MSEEKQKLFFGGGGVGVWAFLGFFSLMDLFIGIFQKELVYFHWFVLLSHSVWPWLPADRNLCVPTCFLALVSSRVRESLGTMGRDVSLCAEGRRGRMERFKNSSIPHFKRNERWILLFCFLSLLFQQEQLSLFSFFMDTCLFSAPWEPPQGISDALTSVWAVAAPRWPVRPIHALLVPLQKLQICQENKPFDTKRIKLTWSKQWSELKPSPLPDTWQ